MKLTRNKKKILRLARRFEKETRSLRWRTRRLAKLTRGLNGNQMSLM